MRKDRRWRVPVAAGFLAVYVVCMVLCTYPVGLRYRDSFQNAFQEKQAEARRILRQLEESAEDGADDAFIRSRCQYLLGTLLSYGSGYQQFSGAVYDAEGRKVTEAESCLGISFGYPYGAYHEPVAWPVRDYLTEEETEELAKYVELAYRELHKSVKAWNGQEPPDETVQYRFTIYVSSRYREPYGIFVQKLRFERQEEAEQEPVKDSLTGAAVSSLTTRDGSGKMHHYYMTDEKIMWQWGNTEAPEGSGWIRTEPDMGNMFPYLAGGYGVWKRWEENAYLHGFPEETKDADLKVCENGRGLLPGAEGRGRTRISLPLNEAPSGYSLLLAYDSHPWMAAVDDMKYIYLICLGLMGVCMCATIRKAEKLYRQQILLEENRRDFTNAMAHELKTPLGVIRGFAENLLEKIHEEKREYYLRQIIGQTDEMDRLAEEMITISRMDSDQMVLQKELLSFGELVREELERIRVVTEEHSIRVEIAAEEEWMFEGDRSFLSRAVRNLVSNAVDHNVPGGNIWVHVEPGVCSIENSGEPLTEEQLVHAFELFYKGEESRRHMGLGLYLARRILKLHGLTLEIGNTKRGVKVVIRS